jgi:hypothetical protein
MDTTTQNIDEPRYPQGSLRDFATECYPPGTERLSEEIDAIVYGA